MGCNNSKYTNQAPPSRQHTSSNQDVTAADQPTEQPKEDNEPSSDLGGLYEELRKQYPDGKLTKEEFKKCYFGFIPSGDAVKFTEHTLRTFDTDADGTIDFREFICALNLTSNGTQEEKMKWAFSLYDVDGNGYITREEALEIISSAYKMQKATGNSKLGDVTPEQKVDEMFGFDKDKDGRITLAEFIEGSRTDPSFVMLVQ